MLLLQISHCLCLVLKFPFLLCLLSFECSILIYGPLQVLSEVDSVLGKVPVVEILYYRFVCLRLEIGVEVNYFERRLCVCLFIELEQNR